METLLIVPIWIVLTFIFVVGCCVGSFLNVVIYRLPTGKSLVTPPSACPNCGRHIAFYDNIPLLSWLILTGKCRYCKTPISPRYFIIELLTGITFTAMFVMYFDKNIWAGVNSFGNGGWLIYLVSVAMLSALIAASAIDLQLWIIPIPICWFVTVVGLIASSTAVFVIDPAVISQYCLLPSASAGTAALSVGAAIGLVISIFLLQTGVIKRSYESENQDLSESNTKANTESQHQIETVLNHRIEVLKEIVFLLPVIICSVAVFEITRMPAVRSWWINFSQQPVMAGLTGSLWGYFVGCGLIWATRILGTLGFGKEAMGLGDVHLMGAAGAVIGPVFVVIAFFVAPFFGLTWALFQMFFKKSRQIPYGPFLSLGVLTVMILHDWIIRYIIGVYCC